MSHFVVLVYGVSKCLLFRTVLKLSRDNVFINTMFGRPAWHVVITFIGQTGQGDWQLLCSGTVCRSKRWFKAASRHKGETCSPTLTDLRPNMKLSQPAGESEIKGMILPPSQNLASVNVWVRRHR